MPTTLTQPALVVGAPRIIEDKGIYVFSTPERNAWRTRLLVTVLKKPNVIYESFKPNEPECYFGVYQTVDKGFIQSQGNLKFPFQEVFRCENHAAHRNVIETYFQTTLALIDFDIGSRILVALAQPPVTPGESDNLTHLTIPSTEVWFRVVPTCKIAVVCEYLPLPLLDSGNGSIPEPQQDANPSNAGGGGGGNPSNPPGTNPESPTTPPYNPSNKDNGRTSSDNQYTGSWFVTVNFASHPSTIVNLGDSNPNTIWNSGAKCFEGEIGKTSGSRNIDGLAMYKNGQYVGCVEDFTKSTVQSLQFQYVG